jgi:hypothetical protein
MSVHAPPYDRQNFVVTRDEARWIAANIAKLLALLQGGGQSVTSLPAAPLDGTVDRIEGFAPEVKLAPGTNRLL